MNGDSTWRIRLRALLAPAVLPLLTISLGCTSVEPRTRADAKTPLVDYDSGVVRPVSFEEPVEGETVALLSPGKGYPLDLSGALALGGANNLHIRLVRQRVYEAQLELEQARVMWLPSLVAGIGYNRHDGRLQATEGEVIDAGRNSLFLGGGAALAEASLAGGAGGPSRLVMDLSLADVWFERLAARQQLRAECAGQQATINDTLLAIAEAYFDLIEARGLSANADIGLRATDEMVDLTTKFAAEGQTAESEVARAEAARGLQRQLVEDAHRQTIARNTELARLLRLGPQMQLLPVEDQSVPVEIVDESIPLEELLAEGLAHRPELQQYSALVAAADAHTLEEQWRPWLPHLAVGLSAGSFGGGPSGSLANQSGRADFDAVAAWELRNLGVGNRLAMRRQDSRRQQACLQFAAVRDQVTAQITTAAADVTSYRRQIEATAASIEAAAKSYRLNLQRIQAGEALPIELLQAIRTHADALNGYTTAVANYNRAQFRLLRALGEPPGSHFSQSGADSQSGGATGRATNLPHE